MPENNVTINYAEAEAAFRAEREEGVVDVAFKASPAVELFMSTALNGKRAFQTDFKSLRSAKNLKRMEETELKGNLWIEKAVTVLPLGGATRGSGVQSIDNTPRDTTIIARWAVTRDYQPIGIPEDEWAGIESKRGKGAKLLGLMDLYENKMQTGLKTTIERIAGDILGTNTDFEQGFLSLAAGIGQSSPDTTTYAGISRSTYTAWRGNYTSSTSADMDDPSKAGYILTRMGRMVQTVLLNGANIEDLVFIGGSTVQASFHDALEGINNVGGTLIAGALNFRMNPGKEGGGIPGWTGLHYGMVPLVIDPHCPASYLYLIDTMSSGFRGLRGSIFNMLPWKPSEAATLFFSRIRNIGQFLIRHPRRNYLNIWA